MYLLLSLFTLHLVQGLSVNSSFTGFWWGSITWKFLGSTCFHSPVLGLQACESMWIFTWLLGIPMKVLMPVVQVFLHSELSSHLHKGWLCTTAHIFWWVAWWLSIFKKGYYNKSSYEIDIPLAIFHDSCFMMTTHL